MDKYLVIEPKLLSHPWYRSWECGAVSKDALRFYAQEYYWQVANFPRYLSLLHSQLENLQERQILLKNLADEENPREPHPELWLDFAESLGLDRQETQAREPGPAARALIGEFRETTARGSAEGLGALFAYESQVPEIAQFKAKALREHYLAGALADKGTRFFDVHRIADVWHTEELGELIAKLSPDGKTRAAQAARRSCEALWRFLDAMPD